MTMGDADRWAQAYFYLHHAAIDANACVWTRLHPGTRQLLQGSSATGTHAWAELRAMILKPNETCEDFFMQYNQVRTEAELTAQHFDTEQLERLQGILPSIVV